MRIPSETVWTSVMVISAAAAMISALMAVLSAMDGSMIKTVLSCVSAAMFAVCTLSAWKIKTKLSALDSADDEIVCLRLKKPGIERKEEIVPKGKMPKELK